MQLSLSRDVLVPVFHTKNNPLSVWFLLLCNRVLANFHRSIWLVLTEDGDCGGLSAWDGVRYYLSWIILTELKITSIKEQPGKYYRSRILKEIITLYRNMGYN